MYWIGKWSYRFGVLQGGEGNCIRLTGRATGLASYGEVKCIGLASGATGLASCRVGRVNVLGW